MRENRTYGSVRGGRQAFHLHNVYERSVEHAYSTNILESADNEIQVKGKSYEEELQAVLPCKCTVRMGK